jgi:CCR4-NOT transcription complex subunit 1
MATTTGGGAPNLIIPRTSIGSLLLELGSQCSLNAQHFVTTLRSVNASLDELQIAEIVVIVLARSNNSNTQGDGNVTRNDWNLDIVAEVLSQECRNLNLNWSFVAQNLDQPGLLIRSDMDFQILARLFMKISSGISLPPQSFLGSLWSNRISQLGILIFAANSHRNIIDFLPLVPLENRLQGEVPTPPNFSWMCSRLYSTLLELASSGLTAEVVEAMAAAASMYPEYALVCLAPLQDTSGVRAELLKRILPLFTGLPGSRPLSAIIMFKLQQVNPDLLVLLFRYAFKRANTLQDILDIDNRLKSMGNMISRRLEEEGLVDELLGYWCVKADRSSFNLDEVANAILERSPVIARNFVDFLKLHSKSLRPRDRDGGILSFESYTSLLRAIQNYPQIVNIEEVRILAVLMSETQQHNNQVLQQTQVQHFGAVAPNDMDDLPRGPESGEVENEANTYFQRIYTGDINIQDVILLLRRFKYSDLQREQEIFRCMIHNLFDEYRFFHKYPDKELQITGRLFGSLLQYQLISSITLAMAMRYVLQALQKDPEQPDPGGVKMFTFGMIALEQFRSRLIEWPQYCSHLLQIPHLRKFNVELWNDIQRIANEHVGGQGIAVSNNGVIAAGVPASELSLVNPDRSNDNLSAQFMGDVSGAGNLNSIAQNSALSTFNSSQKVSVQSVVETNEANIHSARRQQILERMAVINVEVEVFNPPEATRDQIHFIVNNIARANVDTKAAELKTLLTENYYNWFANYMVLKRIATQLNLHPLYLAILDTLDAPKLNKLILDSAYHSVTKLLQSPNITTSSSERSLLRNLGVWLGQVTLAKNKPLLQRRINLKELLFWGYETGRLIAICSFVAKIIEGCKESKVFRPPNPWLMAVLSVMRELYETEDLKMNIKFEVQVLCKNINVRIEDIPRGNSIATSCRVPIKDSRNPDFSVKSSNIAGLTAAAAQSPPPTPTLQIPTSGSSIVPVAAQALGVDRSSVVDNAAINVGLQEQTVIPNLHNFVQISPTLQFFNTNPTHRRLVSLGIDRAIREIIQPVVERSVAIASITTKQIVLKDFATEPNEQQLRSAALLMITNLAGSLALVTCKESLRVSMGNHIRTLFSSVTNDQQVIEQIVLVCCNENLDLGLALIEKASMERATRELDESLATAIQLRRKLRESGQPFVDTASQSSNGRYPRELPDQLKPRQGGLFPQQLQVYEAFQKLRATAAATAAQSQASGGIDGMNVEQAPTSGPIDMSQALQGYQMFLTRIDMAVKSVQVVAQGREISISMLTGDHEIITLLREMVALTQRVAVAVRTEAAMAFCENVFKRMVESVSASTTDILQLEVMIGIIETLCDTCGGVSKTKPDIVGWLNHYASFNVNDENNRKNLLNILILLFKAKLLRSQDADRYFATFMDGGRNMEWVNIAITFVRKCLIEHLANTHEFNLTFETVSRIQPRNAQEKKQLQKWLGDLRQLQTAKEEQTRHVGAAPVNPSIVAQVNATNQPINNAVNPAVLAQRAADSGARESVTALLESWLKICTQNNDQYYVQYFQMMHRQGVLNTEENADKFFRISTELCIEVCLKSNPTPGAVTNGQPAANVLTYTVIDALAKLFLFLLRVADKESTDPDSRHKLLNRILQQVSRVLIDDHEIKKGKQVVFDQRPYFRLISNLLTDLGVPLATQEPNPSVAALLVPYSNAFVALQPSHVPGFAFAWLQLISHRCFMPHILLARGQKGWAHMHRLICHLLLFLQPFLKHSQLPEPIRKLYKGTLRMLLVLLHDFPDFLADYHLSFCEVIPINCVQLRNLILSAFPKSMRLPDPFTPTLKIERLPDMSQPCKINDNYTAILNERGLRTRIDSYLTNKQPVDLPIQLPSVLVQGNTYNVPLLTSIVIYVGTQAIMQLQSKVQAPLSINSAMEIFKTLSAMDIFKALVSAFDNEGRYNLFTVMANQLRFPNCYTHFFIHTLLFLFADGDNEMIQELITRVLLERSIFHRPHPWGVSITFIELIKNPRFALRRKSFTRCHPEIERVFESLAKYDNPVSANP